MQTILSLDGPLPACSGLLLALLLLVLLDYITGVCVAIQTKTLSSQIGAKGITKKVAMFVVIAFCHVLDTYLLQSETALAALSSVFYLSNEAISILENVGRLGGPPAGKASVDLSGAEIQRKRQTGPIRESF